MIESTGPFLKELMRVRHFFKWQVDKKTGRIFGVHSEYERSFTVLEAVAWGQSGKRYDDEFAAARDVGLSKISHTVKGACDSFNETELRRGILVAIGQVGAK